MTKRSVIISGGLTAEKICSMRQAHTIYLGNDITYVIRICNSDCEDKVVSVTDFIPASAELKEGGDNVSGNVMTWEKTVFANSTLEITYTLTVKNDTSLLGNSIGGGNARVNGVLVGCYDIYIENTFGEVDNKKLISSIDNFNHALSTDTELARVIYNNACSFNFTMADSSVDVLAQIFETGVNSGAGTSSCGVEEMPEIAASYMDMLAPTLYGGTSVSITPDKYFRGESNMSPVEDDLLVGDLVFFGNSGEACVYIYNGAHLLKLDSGNFKELLREDANTVLARAAASERYAVLRPSFALTDVHHSPAEHDESLTDVQKAIIGTALAYHKRGYRVQYDDTTLNIREYRWQRNINPPEAYTTDNVCYTNCSVFCNDVYRFAIGYTECDLSQNLRNLSEEIVWRFTRTDDEAHTPQKMAEIEAAFYENLQAGDVIAVHYKKPKVGGHAMLYVGNGTNIHSGGYNMSYGEADTIEASIKLMRVADLWTEGNPRYVFSALNSICIIRPLKTWRGTTIPQNTLNRITTMKGIVGEKLASRNRYTSVNPGDEITYTFSVFNTNEEPKAIEIEDTVPANTTFVSGDLTNENGKLSYTITVPAKETKKVSYTVKVNEDTPSGTRIESNNATIGGVIHPTHEILVAKTLTKAQQSAITTAYNDKKATLGGAALANAVYSDVLGADAVLKHDTVEGILGEMTLIAERGQVIDGVPIELGETSIHLNDNYFFKSDSYYKKMLVPKMIGGRYIYPSVKFGDAQVRLPREAHLIPGDIIVSKTRFESSTALYMYSNEGLINLDTKTLDTSPDIACQKLLGGKCFVILRPSMADSFEYEAK